MVCAALSLFSLTNQRVSSCQRARFTSLKNSDAAVLWSLAILIIHYSLLVIEDLCQVNNFYCALFSFQNSFQVHEATHIATSNIFNIIFLMFLYPVLSHAHTNCFFRHAKRSAEAAAFVSSFCFQKLQAFYTMQQLFSLRKRRFYLFRHGSKMQHSLAVATHMN